MADWGSWLILSKSSLEVLFPALSQEITPLTNGTCSRQQILQARTRILELTLPTIGGDLLAEVNYVETASKVIEILADRNINPLLITKLFTLDDFFMIADEQGLIQLAKDSGKEKQLGEWLKGFYEGVKQKTSPSQPRQSV